MINIEQFVQETIGEKNAAQIADLLHNMGGGEIDAYNNAVLGRDVKDGIARMALLIRGMLVALRGDIDSISDNSEYMTSLKAALSADDIEILNVLGAISGGNADALARLHFIPALQEAADGGEDVLRVAGNHKDYVYYNRVHFAWIAAESAYRIWGDASQGAATRYLVYSADAMPEPFLAGHQYRVDFESRYFSGESAAASVYLRIKFYDEEGQAGNSIYIQQPTTLSVPETAHGMEIVIVAGAAAGNIPQEEPVALRAAMYACASNAQLEARADHVDARVDEMADATGGAEINVTWEDGSITTGGNDDTASATEQFVRTPSFTPEEGDDEAAVLANRIGFNRNIRLSYPETILVGCAYYTYVLNSARIGLAAVITPRKNLVLSPTTAGGAALQPAYIRFFAKWADGHPMTTADAQKYIRIYDGGDRIDEQVKKLDDAGNLPGMIEHDGRYWCDAGVRFGTDMRFSYTNPITQARKALQTDPEIAKTIVPNAVETDLFRRMVLNSVGDLNVPYWTTRLLIYNPDHQLVQIHSHSGGRWLDVLVSSTDEWIEKSIMTREKKVMIVVNKSDNYESISESTNRVRLFYEAPIGRNSANPFDAGLYRANMAVYHRPATTTGSMTYLNTRSIDKAAAQANPVPFNSLRVGYELDSIPYSSVFYACNDVGFCRNFETFYSAVQNPNSVLYTRYGGLYDGTDHWAAAPYYGSVCSTLAETMAGFDVYYGSDFISRNFKHRRVPFDTFRDARPGLFFSKDGHQRIAIDTYYDAAGNEMIDVYEASKPFMCLESGTFAKYRASLTEGGYTVYDFSDEHESGGGYTTFFNPEQQLTGNNLILLEYGNSIYWGDMPVRVKIPEKIRVPLQHSDGTPKRNKLREEMYTSYCFVKTLRIVRLLNAEEVQDITIDWSAKVQEDDNDYAVIDITEATAFTGRWALYLLDDNDVIINNMPIVVAESADEFLSEDELSDEQKRAEAIAEATAYIAQLEEQISLSGRGNPPATIVYRVMRDSTFTPRRLTVNTCGTEIIGEYGNNTWHKTGEPIRLYIKPNRYENDTPVYPASVFYRTETEAGKPWHEIELEENADFDNETGVLSLDDAAFSPGLLEFTKGLRSSGVMVPNTGLNYAKIKLIGPPAAEVEVDAATGEGLLTVNVENCGGIAPNFAIVFFVKDETNVTYDFHDERGFGLDYLHSLSAKPPAVADFVGYPTAKSYAYYEKDGAGNSYSAVFSVPISSDIFTINANPRTPLEIVVRSYFDTGYGLASFDTHLREGSGEWVLFDPMEESV